MNHLMLEGQPLRPDLQFCHNNLGLSGCHSSFLKKFRAAAQEHQVNLYRLSVEVSAVDQKAPSDELIAKTAAALK